MADFHLGVHTIKSHGVKVVRLHMHDWAILLVLVALDVILNVIEPFHRYVGEDMMTDLKYPLKGNTVPFWAVPVIAMLIPVAVFLVYYIIRRDVYDFHHAILGLLYSVLITSVITDAIKDGVGRPRPDFFWRCFPDGQVVFDPITKDVTCTGIKSVIKEGHKSFPSGHTSWSFAGLGFLALYIAGKVRAFNRKGHVAKLCIVFLPLLAAALVAVSRVDDYWHHWQDVFAGGLIGLLISEMLGIPTLAYFLQSLAGLTMASFCYLQFFPPPYHTDGWGPHAYFQILSESQQQQNGATSHSLNSHPTELQTVTIHPQNDDAEDSSATYTRDTSPILKGATRS